MCACVWSGLRGLLLSFVFHLGFSTTDSPGKNEGSRPNRRQIFGRKSRTMFMLCDNHSGWVLWQQQMNVFLFLWADWHVWQCTAHWTELSTFDSFFFVDSVWVCVCGIIVVVQCVCASICVNGAFLKSTKLTHIRRRLLIIYEKLWNVKKIPKMKRAWWDGGTRIPPPTATTTTTNTPSKISF